MNEIISFIIGIAFWKICDYFADYDDHPNYNLYGGIYAMIMSLVMFKIFSRNYIFSLIGFMLGQIIFLLHDSIYENQILTPKTRMIGILSIIIFQITVSFLLNKIITN